MPRSRAEPVSLKTSSGSANRVIELPRFEIVWPAQNFQKSALSRRAGEMLAVIVFLSLVRRFGRVQAQQDLVQQRILIGLRGLEFLLQLLEAQQKLVGPRRRHPDPAPAQQQAALL